MQPESWENLLNGLAEAVVAADESFRVRFVNCAAERVLGLARAEAVGRALPEVLAGEGSEGLPGPASGWRCERIPGGWAAYGSVAPAAATEAVWMQRAVAAQQLAAVGELAAGVAHEVGAPLTAISVAVEYLLRGEPARDPALRRDLEMVLAQTQRISRLARRLVDLARPAEPELVEIDLNRVVADGFELVGRQLQKAGVEGVLELDPAVRPMRGDANQLQQVLINLVLNAQRAVLAGGGEAKRVTVSTRAGTGANALVVADTGPGIAPEDLPRIFLPFFSRGGGTGLGLSLARSIVHRHGGTLRAEGEPGRGAVFVASLPAGDHDGAG